MDLSFDFGRALARQAEGKALVAHPAFMDQGVAVSTYAPPGATREKAAISQQEAGRHAQAYGGREAIDHVYDCIGLYKDAISTAPFRLMKDDGTLLYETKTPGTAKDAQQGPSQLYELLRRPNPFMLYDELIALLIIDLLLVGNAYWMKWRMDDAGKPLALYRLAPSHVKIIPGQYGPLRYEYQPPGARDKIKIAPEAMIHFRRPNPHDPYYGMGAIRGGGRAMDLEIAVTDTMASYYENKADPSLIIESERRVPRDIYNKIRAQLRAKLAGPGRAGELLVLEQGLKAQTLSRTAADSLFKELSMLSRDRIYTKFRTSPLLFGLIDENSGSNKVSDARREFDNYTLRPFMANLQVAITEHLTRLWDCNFTIDYQTLLPAEDAVKVAGQIAAVPGIKVREVRKQYSQFGISESTGIEWLDEYVLNMPGQEADANGQVIDPETGQKVNVAEIGSADRNLPTEAGRPPKGSNTSGFGSTVDMEGKALSTEEMLARLHEAEMKALSNTERVAGDNRLPGEQRPSDTMATARRVDIDKATVDMVDELRKAATELERGLLDTVEGKALKTSDLVQRVQRSDAWKTFQTRITDILERGAANSAQSGYLHADRTLDDELDLDALAKSVVHRPDGIRSIMRTVKDRVVKRVKEARDRDGERLDFENAVRGAISDWSDRQTLAIADSEATEAYNEAVLSTLEAAGETQVYVEDGEEDDEPCKEANGQVWDIDHARQHRKEHPRCRRAFLSVAEVA
jgi:HK97 family phage portal protein